MVNSMNANPRLSLVERILLLVPAAGGLVFGLAPLLVPAAFAALTGASGDDPYIYRLTGAASFGYAVALFLAFTRAQWNAARLVLIATLVFNLGSVYAVAAQVASGYASFVVYLILAASILIIVIALWMLYSHRALAVPAPDSAEWLVWFLRVTTLLAAGVGLLFLFFPGVIALLFGYKGTDVFLYRQGGAATLGYAVMGFFELRSRAWKELRLPIVMALAFNGLSFVVTVLDILAGDPSPLVYVIGATSLFTTVGTIRALQRPE